VASTVAQPPASKLDERLAKTGPLRKVLMRPELGSIVGAIIVFTVFASLSETFRELPAWRSCPPSTA
jgi:simple sugar transport system permease protein